jgi:hypothetical protein
MKFPKFTFEEIYPIIGGALGFIISVFLIGNCIPEEFDKILDASINFSSILTGFVGALIAILFSIKDTELMKYLFKYKKKNVLLHYFKNTVLSGIIIVIFSAILYLRNNLININIVKFSISVWIFLIIYFILASYRIIDIMMIIIFKDPNSTQNRTESDKISSHDDEELKRNLVKRINNLKNS